MKHLRIPHYLRRVELRIRIRLVLRIRVCACQKTPTPIAPTAQFLKATSEATLTSATESGSVTKLRAWLSDI
jgi:hypothetical protein